MSSAIVSPRVLVFAYSEVGYACLEYLIQAKANIIGVVSHHDKVGEAQWFRSVPNLAKDNNLSLFQPESLKAGWYERFLALQPDIILSFYYRNMISTRILDLAALGAFNMHGSLLPKYRGRTSIHWAIIEGETQTGATLHHMVKAADAGDIVDQEAVPILFEDDALALTYKVRDAAVKVLDRQLPQLLAGTSPRKAQDASLATVFGGRTPEDGRINWSQDPIRIYNLIRAVTRPFPGAFTDINDKRIFIWKARPLQGSYSGLPGSIISQSPFIIKAQEGALEILDYTESKLVL
jgi:methionyl-tRNA formyltransferase